MQIHGAGVFTLLTTAEGDGDPAALPKDKRPVDKIWKEDEALAEALATRKPGPHSSCKDFPVPSGAVYLAQMMVHDIVRSLPTGNKKDPFSSTVTRPFMLDSLYGAGPASDAHLFEKEKNSQVRTKFLKACLVIEDNQHKTGPDLYRLMHGQEEVLKPVKQKPGYTDEIGRACLQGLIQNGILGLVQTVLGDMRNDSHTIIGQMTAAWQRHHNKLVDRSLGWIDQAKIDSLTPGKLLELRFLLAQNAVRRTWLRVIENDALPWIVGPASPGLSTPYQPGTAPPASVILALRTLHALPQQVYKLNKFTDGRTLRSILEIGSHSVTPTHMTNLWKVDWDLFFDPNPAGHTCSAPCTCALNRTAYEVKHASDLKIARDPDARPIEKSPAFAIDLMRSRQMVEGTGQQQIPDSYSAKLPEGLKTPEDRKTEVQKLLADANIMQTQKEEIAANPPLLLILLMEAEHKDGGNRARLGPLGSALLQPWLSQAIQHQREALQKSEFAAPEAAIGERFLDIIRETETQLDIVAETETETENS